MKYMIGLEKVYIQNAAKLEEIKTMCEDSREDVLYYYCICMQKLCKVCQKVEITEMLSYIRQIIFPAFPLVLQHFNEQAIEYFQTNDFEARARILEDIEISVETFGEVWEAISQSTNAADRMLIQSAPIGSIRQVPIKACAYYSSMLNDLAIIFQQDEVCEYGFSVYPSFGKRPEAILLFMERKKKGKVGIIRIPEKDISDIQYLRMLISHEFYHIVPGSNLRYRQERAIALESILLYALREKIFYGIQVKPETQKRLELYLFSDCIAKFARMRVNIDGGDRKFYSTEMLESYSDYLIKHVLQILSMPSTYLWNALWGDEYFPDFQAYKLVKDSFEENYQIIQDNVLNLFASAEIPKLCRFYCDVFREVYADLLSVISFQVSADEYISSFCYSVSRSEDSLFRPQLYLRVCLIIGIMVEESPVCVGYKLFDDWRKWWRKTQKTDKENRSAFINEVTNFLNEISDSLNLSRDYAPLEDKDDEERLGKVYVLPDVNIWVKYMEYLRQCKNGYLRYEKRNEQKFFAFRKKYLIDPTIKNAEILNEISRRAWEVVTI